MIRFHPVPATSYSMTFKSERFLVSSRRKPRGFIESRRAYVEVTKLSQDEASYTTKEVVVWDLFALDGRQLWTEGLARRHRHRPTKRARAVELLMDLTK